MRCSRFVWPLFILVCPSCHSLDSASPTALPTFGNITVQFRQTTLTSCTAVGTSFCDPNAQLVNRIQANVSWFDPTIGPTGAHVYLSSDGVLPNADGSATMKVDGLPKGRMTISVFNPWACPAQKGHACGDGTDGAMTGRGITVNGVALIDRDPDTEFTFQPPDTVIR